MGMILFEKHLALNDYCDICGSRCVVARIILNGVKSIGLNSKVDMCHNCVDMFAYEVNNVVKPEE